MKKYVIILFAIFFTGAMNSCKDALDLPEDGRISYESIWADGDGTMGCVNSGYGIFERLLWIFRCSYLYL